MSHAGTHCHSSSQEALTDPFLSAPFQNFNSLLQTGNTGSLNKVLASINSYLAKKGTRYLMKDTITYADCQLLPKLQHLRVAGKVPLTATFPLVHRQQNQCGISMIHLSVQSAVIARWQEITDDIALPLFIIVMTIPKHVA